MKIWHSSMRLSRKTKKSRKKWRRWWVRAVSATRTPSCKCSAIISATSVSSRHFSRRPWAVARKWMRVARRKVARTLAMCAAKSATWTCIPRSKDACCFYRRKSQIAPRKKSLLTQSAKFYASLSRIGLALTLKCSQ